MAATALAVEDQPRIDTGEFGEVDLYAPQGTAKAFAFLFSGAEGLTEADRQAATRLTQSGVAVAAIDTKTALKHLNEPDPDQACIELPGPLEWLSHNAQHDFKFTEYREPVLLGRGAGGALVYAALAQSPPLSFAGGVSVDFNPSLGLQRKFCGLTPASVLGNYQTLAPTYRLRGGWRIGATLSISPEVMAFAEASARANDTAPVQAPKPASLDAIYLDVMGPLLNAAATLDKTASVEDLPLVEVSSRAEGDTFVIIYSGDGGWRDIDKILGDFFAARGLAVVGVDALRYFWSERSPEETAHDLAQIITHYRAAWNLKRVVLIGYSFGANILPFAYNRLPPELQQAVIMLALLAPARAADFEISVFGWLSAAPSAEALLLLPEVSKIDPAKLQCIFGAEEADETLCTTNVMRNAERIERPGSHHFDENYAVLGNKILQGIQRRMRAGSIPIVKPKNASSSVIYTRIQRS
jgi:type IV secretory pathway VirJ component